MFDDRIEQLRVASVQLQHPVAEISGYIIDPRNLTIVALQATTRHGGELRILHTSDIKETGPQGVIIDHNDQLMEDEDLIRLDEIRNFNFKLIGKPVKTEDGASVGKVNRFVVDTTTWKVMKIHTRLPVTKNLQNSEAIIHRSQILQVTDKSITVKSTAVNIRNTKKFSLKKLLFGAQQPDLEPNATQIRK
jgi:sporulation protein YlmC with PRC-barrel domain